MSETDEPQQITIMKQMLALAERQCELSEQRTRMAESRTRMAADRSKMSEDRSRMSAERSRMSEERSQMSADRSRMSADRSEMSETRSYHNAERTLSVWVRTAMSLMVLGIAMDRFGLLLHRIPGGKRYAHLHSNELLNALSMWTGAALVVLGIFMALITGARFVAYAKDWKRNHRLPPHHGPYLAAFFALMTAFFGILLLVLMLVFAS
ncbi:MAG TPA: DUF202 domain-containing protein [Oleiagrimonas sp.]|nr:DUF202 domain-containing protein [Oleiagrimonas sp.]